MRVKGGDGEMKLEMVDRNRNRRRAMDHARGEAFIKRFFLNSSLYTGLWTMGLG